MQLHFRYSGLSMRRSSSPRRGFGRVVAELARVQGRGANRSNSGEFGYEDGLIPNHFVHQHSLVDILRFRQGPGVGRAAVNSWTSTHRTGGGDSVSCGRPLR